jgi:hypothetical protein
MIRPVKFGFNEQTSGDNAFQVKGDEQEAATKAGKEFDAFVSLLKAEGVEVTVIEDTPEPHTPDSIFPNNWFSTHQGGTLVFYPMFAPNRRLERKPAVVEHLRKLPGVRRVVDLTDSESKGKFLEGTGSMVFDRDNNLVYACRSPRTNEEVLERFCDELDFDYYLFDAVDAGGNPIYHTNVMMSVCTGFIVACLDSIRDIDQRSNLIALAEESDKEVVEISLDQMAEFAGNMLEVRSAKGEPLLIMSARARKSLTRVQSEQLEKYCKIVSPDLTTIENNGGGSARCMIAELFI